MEPAIAKLQKSPRSLGARNAHGWRAKLAALRSVPRFLQLAWHTHRGYAAGTVVVRLLRASVPLAVLWVGKLIIDTVVAARTGKPDLSRLWWLVALELLIAAVGEALDKASAAMEGLYGDLLSHHISEKLITHAATLDLYHFEDPAFYDQLERAQRQTTGRIGLLPQVLSIGQDSLTFFSLAAAVFLYSPWLLALLLVAVLPGFLGETHFSSLEYLLLYRMTPERRQLDYLRYLSASDKTAKEVQMFGLADWLLSRYRTIARRFHEENRKLVVRKGFAATVLSIAGLIAYYAAYVVILKRGFYGVISIGSLTFLAASFLRSRLASERALMTAGNIYEQSLYLTDLFDFFKMQPSIVSAPKARPVPSSIREVVFDRVGFRYPGSEHWAVRQVSFRIHQGEKVALVGENGAGKTTITKLLARLYDPTEGRILMDGVDLREYDLASVRQNIGVIFQDFVHYDLRLDENIGIGEIRGVQESLDRAASSPEGNDPEGNNNDKSSTDSAIIDAARKSQADELARRLPFGYRQMLGRRFQSGIDLSGGEWQKVALARAYIRKAQLIILDEATAALDARAEYETFQRFSEIVSGQMVVLISHRFSTVRMADRIIVLQKGAIIEEGTHDQLLAHNGIYAELFQLQAKGYR